MGWNELRKEREFPLWNGLVDGSFVYYVHSYYADCPDEIVCGVSDYGMQVPGFVAKGNVFVHSFIQKKWRNWHANIKNFQGVVEAWKSSQLSI